MADYMLKIMEKPEYCPHCLDLLFRQINNKDFSLETLYDFFSPNKSDNKSLKKIIKENVNISCSRCESELTKLEKLNNSIKYLQDGFDYYMVYKGELVKGLRAYYLLTELVSKGVIIAVKGIGGYHLLCDARNNDAITLLRKRIHRLKKPFSVMVRDIEMAQSLATISHTESSNLLSKQRPIVLVRSKRKVAHQVALKNKDIGIFLPYLPIHYLLFTLMNHPLIMTSANLPGEPTIINDESIIQFMSELEGAVVANKQKIVTRSDDSVIKVVNSTRNIIRRGRGFKKELPYSIRCGSPILALGADLKGGFTLLNNGRLFFSNYLGDLTNYKAQLNFENEVNKLVTQSHLPLEDLVVGHDLHPEFFTTKLSEQFKRARRIPVQHHHAHVAAVLFEHQNFDQKVVGISFDGTGYGDNGTIWGGEILIGSLRDGFTRYGHLQHAKLIGGDAAITYPIQALAGFFENQINRAYTIGKELQLPKRFHTALQILEKDIATFTTTSIGRLFDAVAAILGFHCKNSFEGEAAMWLEHLTYEAEQAHTYPFPWRNNNLQFEPLLFAIIEDVINGVPHPTIAKSFHHTVAKSIVHIIDEIRIKENINLAVLVGGVFQNSVLLGMIDQYCNNKQIKYLTGNEFPINDGSISLGQLAIIQQQLRD